MKSKIYIKMPTEDGTFELIGRNYDARSIVDMFILHMDNAEKEGRNK